MTKPSLFFAAAIFLGSVGAVAQTPSEEVGAMLAPHVGTLNRPLVAFHYQSDPKFEPRSTADLALRLAGRPERFFDPSKRDETSVGPGLYLAADPANSRNYGGETPHLFVFTLRSETRVLNVADRLEPNQLARARAIVAELDCGTAPTNLESFVKSLRNSDRLACRNVAIDAIRRLAVGAILYDYFKPFPLPGCRGTRDAAIDVIDSGVFVPDTLEYYSHVRHLGPSVQRASALGLYRETMADPYRAWAFADDVPKFLSGEITATADYEAWKSNFILGCGPGRAAEGDWLRGGRVIDVTRRQHRDVEIKRLYDRAKAAFGARILPWLQSHGRFADFAMTKLRWLQRLEHRALPRRARRMTFAEFQMAKDLSIKLGTSANDGDARRARLAALLGEDVSALIAPTRDSLEAAGLRISPGELNYFTLSKSLGLGNRGAFLATNFLVNEQHGIPLLVRPNRRRSMREAIAASRVRLENVLKTCLARYEDPKVDPADIADSLCGVETPIPN